MNSTKITEQINPKSIDIQKKKICEILKIFTSEDLIVIQAIEKILPELEKLINAIITTFKNNGRFDYKRRIRERDRKY